MQRARGRATQRQDSSGLSIAQYIIMAPLRGGSQTMSDLAISAGVSGPTATRAVTNLVGSGLVERVPSGHDRRQVAVHLTPAGEQALALKEQAVRASEGQFIASLTPQQHEEGAILLERIAELLDEISTSW
ncbi:MarR family transcriptional regulator [Frankia sp. AgPm24]|uniref:MarR family winged helix-turn-helix transcriptional regulator n=1 Tax=Frankia sp. AgPm24 TaxID=631128 RepID=UPI00200E7D15|nr:MarR family transcriptional regulator [Frankia sp. AgPm24]MCK9923136.1 MarR family transcriptional regulator [Frankia sp. AgPm24]